MIDLARLLGVEDLDALPTAPDRPEGMGDSSAAVKVDGVWKRLGYLSALNDQVDYEQIKTSSFGGFVTFAQGLSQRSFVMSLFDVDYHTVRKVFEKRLSVPFFFSVNSVTLIVPGFITDFGEMSISAEGGTEIDLTISVTGKVENARNLEEEALVFARKAHAGQTRKYDGKPYIFHPMAVAQIMRDFGFGAEEIAAAYLHDTVEDTPTTIEDIRAQFGDKVADLVAWLTDVSKKTDGNRKTRKHLDLVHMAKAPVPAQNIKLADLIDNTRDIKLHDPGFWPVYRAEKRALVGVLREADPRLLEIAMQQIGED